MFCLVSFVAVMFLIFFFPLPTMYLQVSTLHYFLMEVNLTMANSALSFTLKCEKQSQTEPFVKHFLQALVAKNIIYK